MSAGGGIWARAASVARCTWLAEVHTLEYNCFVSSASRQLVGSRPTMGLTCRAARHTSHTSNATRHASHLGIKADAVAQARGVVRECIMHGDGAGDGGGRDGRRLGEVNEIVNHPLVLLLVRRRRLLEALLDDIQATLHEACGLHETGVEHAHVDALAGEFALEAQSLAQSLHSPFSAHVAATLLRDRTARRRARARTPTVVGETVRGHLRRCLRRDVTGLQ